MGPHGPTRLSVVARERCGQRRPKSRREASCQRVRDLRLFLDDDLMELSRIPCDIVQRAARKAHVCGRAAVGALYVRENRDQKPSGETLERQIPRVLRT